MVRLTIRWVYSSSELTLSCCHPPPFPLLQKGEVHAAMYGCATAGVCATGSDVATPLGTTLLGGSSGACHHPHNEVWLRNPKPPSSAASGEVE